MTPQEMIRLLLEMGMTQDQIAQECYSTQPTISRIKNGASARYGLGKQIEALYLRKTQVPVNAA